MCNCVLPYSFIYVYIICHASVNFVMCFLRGIADESVRCENSRKWDWNLFEILRTKWKWKWKRNLLLMHNAFDVKQNETIHQQKCIKLLFFCCCCFQFVTDIGINYSKPIMSMKHHCMRFYYFSYSLSRAYFFFLSSLSNWIIRIKSVRRLLDAKQWLFKNYET